MLLLAHCDQSGAKQPVQNCSFCVFSCSREKDNSSEGPRHNLTPVLSFRIITAARTCTRALGVASVEECRWLSDSSAPSASTVDQAAIWQRREKAAMEHNTPMEEACSPGSERLSWLSRLAKLSGRQLELAKKDLGSWTLPEILLSQTFTGRFTPAKETRLWDLKIEEREWEYHEDGAGKSNHFSWFTDVGKEAFSSCWKSVKTW